MPRKKAEPEVLQEETVQPEITDIEELTPAERPGLAPQIEEPVQPYGEEESSAAEELHKAIHIIQMLSQASS